MRFEFGDFCLDTDRCLLLEGGREIKLEPKSYELLSMFVSAGDRVISRDEIIDTVWKGIFVSDSSVSTAIKNVRKALGDDGASQDYIKTVRGRGFRFVAAVSTAGQASAATASPSDTAAAPDTPHEPGRSTQPAIAVIPFAFMGDADRQSAIAEAIPTELISSLSRLRWLKVIARGSSFRFDPGAPDFGAIRAQLAVDYVLSGSVELTGTALSIFVELTDARNSQIVWSDRHDGALEDVFDMRANIARSAVSAMEIQIPVHEASRLDLVAPGDLTAWEHYHLGVRHMFRYNAADIQIAEKHFRHALSLDPKFARAYAGLSHTEFQNHFQRFGSDLDRHMFRALEYAEKSVDLDPLDPLGNLILARSKWLHNRVEDALAWGDRAIDLNPNYAFGYYNLANFKTVLCDGDGADEDTDRALHLSPLDPNLTSFYGTRALAAFTRGDLDAASRYADKAMQSPNAHLYVNVIAALVHGQTGNDDAAAYCVDLIRQKNVPFTKADFLRHFDLRDPQKRADLTSALDKVGIH